MVGIICGVGHSAKVASMSTTNEVRKAYLDESQTTSALKKALSFVLSRSVLPGATPRESLQHCKADCGYSNTSTVSVLQRIRTIFSQIICWHTMIYHAYKCQAHWQMNCLQMTRNGRTQQNTFADAPTAHLACLMSCCFAQWLEFEARSIMCFTQWRTLSPFYN